MSSRAQNIEKEARMLLAWVDEFVGEVKDNRGASLTASGEWADALGDLRRALEPAPTQAPPPPILADGSERAFALIQRIRENSSHQHPARTRMGRLVTRAANGTITHQDLFDLDEILAKILGET